MQSRSGPTGELKLFCAPLCPGAFVVAAFASASGTEDNDRPGHTLTIVYLFVILIQRLDGHLVLPGLEDGIRRSLRRLNW